MGSGSPGASSRSEVAEWEEPRHPGPAVRAGKYPTLPHSATQLSSSVPPTPVAVRLRTHFAWKCASSAVGRWLRCHRTEAHVLVHTGALHEKLQTVSSAAGVPTRRARA